MSYAGTIFLEPRMDAFVTESFKDFFQIVACAFNYKIVYTMKPNAKDAVGDVVIINNIPLRHYPKLGAGTLERILDTKKKLILVYRDIHGTEEYDAHLHTAMDRADMIFTFHKEMFERKFIKHIDKFIWMPQYFSKTNDYLELSSNMKSKVHKCLVPGMICDLYPIRNYIRTARVKDWVNDKGLFDMIPHPLYSTLSAVNRDYYYLGARYAQKISSYCCNVTDTSVYKYVLAKHVEIPASGSLLISDYCKDMELYGFKSGVNYLKADDGEHAVKLVEEVTANPEMFQSIVDNGRELVRKFSVNNVAGSFINKIKELK